MTEPYPSRLLDRFVLRMPDGLRERLADAAKANGRSMNAEMVMALEAWLGREEAHASSAEHIMPVQAEERFRIIVGEALNEALANPDLIRRFRQLDDLKRARNDLAHVSTEDGRQFGPQDRLADADEVQGSREFVYPPLIDSEAISPEDRKALDRERAERTKRQREQDAHRREQDARKRAERA